MTGIESVGTYVPYYRIQRSEIAAQYGESDDDGETAVPNHDEDVVTMARAAGADALAGADVDASALDAVFAASVSDPFAERGIAGEVAHALGTGSDVRLADYRGAPRATADAVSAARDALLAGTAERIVVVASDVLPARRGTDAERTAGAGAGAILLDGEGTGVDLLTIDSETTGFLDPVRHAGDAPQSGHARFNRSMYVDTVGGLLDRIDGPVDRLAAPPPIRGWSERALRGADRSVPLDSTFDSVGDAGAASVVLDTALALENAAVGDRTALIAYGGGGATSMVLETTDGTPAHSMSLETHLESKEYVSYAQHHAYRRGEP